MRKVVKISSNLLTL